MKGIHAICLASAVAVLWGACAPGPANAGVLVKKPQAAASAVVSTPDVRQYDIVVLNAQWSEGTPQPPAPQAANVIRDEVAPFWAEVTDSMVQFAVVDEIDVTVPGPAPTGCQANYDAPADVAGVYPGPYRIVLIALPPGMPGGGCWSGRGGLSGYVRIAGGSIRASVIAHELGHVLGLDHARSRQCFTLDGQPVSDGPNGLVTEYGDSFDIMGDNPTQTLVEPGPVSIDALGLAYVLNPEVSALDASSATYTLSAYSADSGTRAIKVVDEESTYWLEYRTADGYSKWIDPANGLWSPGGAMSRAGVLVRDSSFGSGRLLDATPHSLGVEPMGVLMDAVRPGDSLTTRSGNVRISVLAQDDNTATVLIDRDPRATAAADTEAPDPVAADFQATALDGALAGRKQAGVTWPATTDVGSGVERYEVTQDGEVVLTVDPGEYGPDGRFQGWFPLAEGVHEYSVRAVDLAGNTAASEPVSILGDSRAPRFLEPAVAHLSPGRLIPARSEYRVPMRITWQARDVGGAGLRRTGDVRIGVRSRQVAPFSRGAAPVKFRTGPKGIPEAELLGVAITDRLGNSRASNVRASARMVIDRRYTVRGRWHRVERAAAVGGSRLRTTSAGALAHVVLGTGQYGVVAKRGPHAGSVVIYLRGDRVASIDLRSPTARPRAVVWTSPEINQRARLVVVTTSARPVALDDLVRLRQHALD